jgi:nitrogen fixation protein NifU and related proteins
MSSELEELYQEVILDHSRRPRNFGELPDAAVRVHGDNPSCGDEIHLAVKFGTDNEVTDLKFTGHGCAISQASASMLTGKVKGKIRADAMALLRAFRGLVTAETDESPGSLGDLRLLAGVRKFPQRVKCALLPCRAIEQALEQAESESSVSTEGEG